MYFDAIDVKIKAVEVVSCFSRLYAEIIEPIDYTPEWTINGNDVFYRTIMSSEVPGPLFTVHAVMLMYGKVSQENYVELTAASAIPNKEIKSPQILRY
ncbi:hypothetical protein V6C42_02135 [Pseudoclostridium thermosuccinogenes]|uniref:hypothetical protein n=1 Tax=Clostridium thermosuccinogenes TaxID=84032 RepID=UPI002FDB3321